jgi:hypothetical protein
MTGTHRPDDIIVHAYKGRPMQLCALHRLLQNAPRERIPIIAVVPPYTA